MSERLIQGLLVAATSFVLSEVCAAHEREFTQSRDWHLPYVGEHEFELRSFFDTSHGDYRGQLEYEYGVTSHFALEPGFEVKEKPDEEGHYEVEALELELRFNFGTYRDHAWLPALNVEYEHPFEDEEADKVELKSVLSRYGDLDDFTVNLNYGREIEDEHEDESELTAGWLHRFVEAEHEYDQNSSGPKAGLELVEDFEAHALRAGPLAVWRASLHFNLLASWLFAVDGDEENFDELSIILEWEL